MNLAKELQSRYFSANQESTRKVAAELKAILTSVEAACTAHDNNTVSYMSLGGREEGREEGGGGGGEWVSVRP